ncbi:unnamed protein product [Heligmosomoides polygyrus]|uniref:Paired domain-containing protein n=1 Tax=Heligmosomoides polygyrus TaxID=6339 RepID=A0A183FRS5_HELPZ|nr:unnamed protein product [Heligmosomoides polygyrus]
MRRALYFYGISWRQFECTFGHTMTCGGQPMNMSAPHPSQTRLVSIHRSRSDGRLLTTRRINAIFSGTNLYGRPYCPGRPLSMAERRRIIDLHMSGMKVNAISKSLCISHGCVSKIISRYGR